MAFSTEQPLDAARPRMARGIMVGLACAGAVTLTWLVAQQQSELTSQRAAAAAATSFTVIIFDSPAHVGCEEIDNHSSHPVVIELRSSAARDKGTLVRIAPEGSTQICVNYAGVTTSG